MIIGQLKNAAKASDIGVKGCARQGGRSLVRRWGRKQKGKQALSQTHAPGLLHLPGKKDLLLSSPTNATAWGGQKCGEPGTPSFKHGNLFLPGSSQEGDNLQTLGVAEASSTKRGWRRE